MPPAVSLSLGAPFVNRWTAGPPRLRRVQRATLGEPAARMPAMYSAGDPPALQVHRVGKELRVRTYTLFVAGLR